MKIEEILKEFPHCRLCTKEDNEIIITFLKSQSMRLGILSLRYERGPDFFSFNKKSSDLVYTIMIFDKHKNDIVGIGCITKRPCQIKSGTNSYYYNSDLRIKRCLDHSLKEEWRRCHARLVEKLNDSITQNSLNKEIPKLCAILDQNQNAVISLTKKHDDLIFHQVKKYYSINIMGRLFNFSDFFQSFYKVSPCDEESSEFQCFYNEESGKRHLAEISPTSQGHHLTIKNSHGELIGICTLKSQDHRKFIVTEINKIFKLVNYILPIVGIRPILIERPLSFLYIDNLIFKTGLSLEEKRKMLQSVLNYLFINKLNKKYHFISIPSFPEEYLEKRLKFKGYIYQKIPGTLYQLIHKNNVSNEKHFQYNKWELPLINLSDL